MRGPLTSLSSVAHDRLSIAVGSVGTVGRVSFPDRFVPSPPLLRLPRLKLSTRSLKRGEMARRGDWARALIRGESFLAVSPDSLNIFIRDANPGDTCRLVVGVDVIVNETANHTQHGAVNRVQKSEKYGWTFK